MSDVATWKPNGSTPPPAGYAPDGYDDDAESAEFEDRQDAIGLTTTKPKPFKFTRLGDLLADITPVDWLIKRFLAAETMSMLFGEPESGKSLVSVDMGMHIATGRPWRGQRVKQGTVFYICGEGQSGVARRMKAWCDLNQLTPAEANAAAFYVSEAPAQFTDNASAVAVNTAVRELIEATGETPALVIVDTVARNFGAADENSAKDMGRFVHNLDMALVKDLKVAVQVVHHTGHGDKTRGRASSALPAALDNHYKITRDTEGPVRMESTKSKDFAKPDPVQFRLTVVGLGFDDEDGDPVTGATIEHEDFKPPKASSDISGGERFCLDNLKDWYMEVEKRVAGGEVLLPIVDWRKRCIKEQTDSGKHYDAALKYSKRAIDSLLGNPKLVLRREDNIHIFPAELEAF